MSVTGKPTPNDELVSAIVQSLDKCEIPWSQPWVSNPNGIVSYATGLPYSLRNRMILKLGGEYATFNQIRQAGGQVVKGEHSFVVYFSKRVVKKSKEDDGEEYSYRYLTKYNVFRVGSQTTGLEYKYADKWQCGGMPKSDPQILETVEDYASRTGLHVLDGGDRAFYEMHRHLIQVPGNELFQNKSEYWHTVFHELVHSTGKVLGRDMGGNFGSSPYAREELVADIGASLCLGALGISTEKSIQNSAAYCTSWKKHIKSLDLTTVLHDAQVAMELIINNNKE